MDRAIRAAIGEWAAKHHSLITRKTAYEFGLDRSEVQREVDSGRWVRMRRNVFLIGGAVVTWRTEVMAAVLAAGPSGVASHRTAAALWGLEGFDSPRLIELTVPRHRRRKLTDG